MKHKTVGIIGGMGSGCNGGSVPKIIRATPASTDQEHLRILIDNNPAIPDRTKAILYGGKSPLSMLSDTARNLEAAGAQLLVMPCNTAHYYHSLIQQSVHIPLLHMMRETGKAIQTRYPTVKTVGLLATEGTVQSKLYHNALEALGICVLVPDGVHQRILTEAIYGEDGIKAGQRMGPAVRVKRAASYLIELGSELIIAGCTEIPLVLRDGDCAVPVLDPTQVLAEAAVREAMTESMQSGD